MHVRFQTGCVCVFSAAFWHLECLHCGLIPYPSACFLSLHFFSLRYPSRPPFSINTPLLNQLSSPKSFHFLFHEPPLLLNLTLLCLATRSHMHTWTDPPSGFIPPPPRVETTTQTHRGYSQGSGPDIIPQSAQALLIACGLSGVSAPLFSLDTIVAEVETVTRRQTERECSCVSVRHKSLHNPLGTTWHIRWNGSQICGIYFTYLSGKVSIENICLALSKRANQTLLFCRLRKLATAQRFSFVLKGWHLPHVLWWATACRSV